MLAELPKHRGGKQIDWDSLTRPADQPLITIITSTFNAAKDLHWTGNSIRNQTYPYIQWIIADGASSDDTLSAVQQYDDIVDLWFSQPDEGIYDAWNKALKYAKGDWVQFIGAGDELADSETLKKIAPVLAGAYPEHELVYGNLMFISEIERQPLECVGEPWEKIKNKWSMCRPQLPPHPATFHHKSLLKTNAPFEIRFKISSDSYLMIRSILTKEPKYINILIDRMPMGGISGRLASTSQILDENRQISKKLGYRIPLLHFLFELFISSLKLLVRSTFPRNLAFKIADLFRRVCGENKRWSVK